MSDPVPESTSPETPNLSTPSFGGRSERAMVGLVGAVQFVNILDFMMVMPLGPEFSEALGISTSKLGLIGGSYTGAACLSGLAGSFFLDRFDRRKALAVSMFGLVLGTLAGAFAQGFGTLMLARVIAGMFGGPATSISLSIIADVVPPSRRGKAMGAVMGAFAAASVLGVPLGLELAHRWPGGSWRTPFYAVALLGLGLSTLVFVLLPPLRAHLDARLAGKQLTTSPRELFTRPIVLFSYLMTTLTMISGFILIPNLSAFMQNNLHYPRNNLGILYFCGGIVSFATTRIVGGMVDRHGATNTGALGNLVLILIVYFGFAQVTIHVPILLIFIGFMFAMGIRNVSYNTLTTLVPAPHERASFMSIQSAVQHGAAAFGAMASSKILTEGAGGVLVGMPKVAWVTIVISAILPLVFYAVESRAKQPRSVPLG